MQISTTFSIGDKGWVYDGDCGAKQITIANICVKVLNSSTEKETEGNVFWCGYEEWYMGLENQFGSGISYQMGRTIFPTKAKCMIAYSVHIALARKKKQRQRKRDLKDARCRLAEIKKEFERLGEPMR